MAEFTKKLPEWNNPGVEPPKVKKDDGWKVDERPPAAYMNWLNNQTHEALKELQQNAVHKQGEEKGEKASLKERLDGFDNEIGVLQKSNSETINVKSFGAVGDGTTDDTTAIQNAINSIENGTVTLKGRFNIKGNTLTLKSNVSLIGLDRATEIIKNTDAASQTAMLAVNSNSVIKGIKFVNSYASTGGCISLSLQTNSQNVIIEECEFQGSETQGILLNALGIRDVLVNKCRFNNVGYGILLNSSANNARRITITNNFFKGATRDAIEINSPIKGMGMNREPGDSAKDIIITNNHIEDVTGTGTSVGLGIGIAGAENVVVSKNIIKNCSKRPIHIEDYAKNVIVSDNYTEGGVNGIYLLKTTRDTIVSNNIISGYTDYGIHVTADAEPGTCEKVQIYGNKFIGGKTGAYLTGRGEVDFDVVRNEFRSNSLQGVSVAMFGDSKGYLQINDNLFDRTNCALKVTSSQRNNHQFERNTLLNTKLWDVSESTKYVGKDITFIFVDTAQADSTKIIAEPFSDSEVKYFDGSILARTSDGINNIKGLTINGTTITKTDKYNNATGSAGAMSGSTYSWVTNKFQVIVSYGTAPAKLDNLIVQFQGSLFS